jgi:hypothetical protein
MCIEEKVGEIWEVVGYSRYQFLCCAHITGISKLAAAKVMRRA